MKKFLLILLIAVASSVTVTIDDPNLEGIVDWAKKIWDFIKSLAGKLKDFYNWLKANGYWDQIIELVKKYGQPFVIQQCTNWTGQGELCNDIISLLFSFLK